MTRVVSFHLVRERPGRAVAALTRLATDRPRLDRTPGLLFWRVLGTGAGRATSLGVDPRRTALFAVWADAGALDRFRSQSVITRRWADAAEVWSTCLAPVSGHGTWNGFDPLAGSPRVEAGAGPLAVLTRAVVRPRAWPAFVRAGRGVSRNLQGAPGLLAVAGIGEAPIGRQATFSVWRSTAAMEAYAYGAPEHTDVVARTRLEHWYGEQLFARFVPYDSSGRWDGVDPLHGLSAGR
jgi:hypothetical protein